MTTQTGLIAAALLFWGWQTEAWAFPVVAAAVLEGSRVVSWRWDVSRAELQRVATLCRLVLLGIAVYQGVTRGPARAVIGTIQWAPLAVLPLAVGQLYNVKDMLDLRTFFLVLRRPARSVPAAAGDLAHAYLGLCLLAASAANRRTPGFYAGLCVLSAWALWPARSRRFSPVVWAALLAVGMTLGYVGHVALRNLQQVLEGAVTELVFSGPLDTDPYRNRTAIGEIGTLKLSDRIVLRVEPGPDTRLPILLREASYSIYHASSWLASDSAFHAVGPEPDGTTWTLQRAPTPTRRVTVSGYLKRGAGMLALPNGTSRVGGLRALGVERTVSGAVKVEDGLGLVAYTAYYDPDGAVDGPPSEVDLRIPKAESAAVPRLAADLRLRERPPRDALRTVAAFFQEQFRYSTFLGDHPAGSAALERFLLGTRSGHCEYFATATVFLLRAAGIPARYAVGYSVQEWSGLEKRYVVRARHAHSWALAYVDGTWRDVDTTPAVWADVERQGASVWEPLADLVSWGLFRLFRWRSEREDHLPPSLGWLLAPLVGWLSWRLWRRRRLARTRVDLGPPRPVVAAPGLDSEFYAIERRLGELGPRRHPGEPISHWIRRFDASPAAPASTASLEPIVVLHYRYRFDPQGISAPERERLRSWVRAWLAERPERADLGR